MPISKSTELFNLIKSLSSAEKRNFTLYANRNHENSQLKFIELFELIDKASIFDEKQFMLSLNEDSKPKFANLKRHLYTQILKSLRVIKVSKRPNVKLRGLLDYAYILYEKGFYIEALKILSKAKRHARKYHLNYMHLTIIEFEKRIESRHITRSGTNKAVQLIKESTDLNIKLQNATKLSNLRTYLHGRYIQNGHCRTSEEKEILINFFNQEIEDITEYNLGPMSKIYLYQSYVWFHYILLDFNKCLNYSEKWLNILKSDPNLVERDADLFLRAYHYVLSSCFHLKLKNKLTNYLSELELFRNSNYKRFNKISQIISFQYVHSARLNNIILTGKFQEGPKIIARTLQRIKKYELNLDAHRILVFYFKIAWINFGNNNFSKSIFYLNKIVNNELPKLREDLQIYSRLMFLMCHYELGNYDLLDYSIKSFTPYFKKPGNQYTVKEIIQNTFLKLSVSPYSDHKSIMMDSLKKLRKTEKIQFNKVSFTYLDVISWLEAKITNQSLSEIIQNK